MALFTAWSSEFLIDVERSVQYEVSRMIGVPQIMLPQTLYFASNFPDDEVSIKSKELENASRRSHAAKISHQRRKKGNIRSRTNVAGNSSEGWQLIKKERNVGHAHKSNKSKVFDNEFHDYDNPDRSHADRTVQIAFPAARTLINNPLMHGNSDPFMTTPTPVTAKEYAALRALQDAMFHMSWPHHAGVDLGPIDKDWTRYYSTTFKKYIEAGTHLRGLSVLVEAYGGFLSLPYPARALLMVGDHVIAVATMRSFTWSSELYDPGPLNLSPLEEQQVDDIMRNWPPVPKGTPDHLQSFFLFHREICAVYQVALKLKDRQRRTKPLHWVLLRKRMVYSTTQDKRCLLAARGSGDDSKLSEDDIDLAIDVSVRIAVQYMLRLIYWPQPGQISVWADINDVQIWLGSPRVRSRASRLLLPWLLAVSTSMERALRQSRSWLWWHAPRFLLLAEDMELDDITRLTPAMEQFVWADEPIGRYVQCVFKERDSIYEETSCRWEATLSRVRTEKRPDLIWDAPLSNAVEDRVLVVQWTKPKAVVK